MSDKTVLLALSGGLDSAVLLAYLLHEGYSPECVGFYYGSKHNAIENEAAKKIAAHYSVNLTMIDISGVMAHFKSDLLLSGGAIPEGHYNDETMSRTVVPARNMIFYSILVGLAESRRINHLALGVHQGDHHIYPDCRPDFINAMKYAGVLATEGKVKGIAPFSHWNKADIVRVGLELNVPFELTRTCYKTDEVACGKCGSCTERLEAFALNNAIDPIQYQKK